MAIQEDAQCPANSSRQGDDCVCDVGYLPSSDGTSCVLISDSDCPENSTRYGKDCYCDEGYGLDDTRTGCEPIREAACPPNAHRQGTRCVCDEGYHGNPEAPEGECLPIELECQPLERPNQAGTDCVCIEGFVQSSEGCLPAASPDCGNETWLGRCIDERYLVYCVTEAHLEYGESEESLGIWVEDCEEENLKCGDEGDGFNNCVADRCGNIDYSGRCEGSMLIWCDEGELYEIDCGNYDATCELADDETGYDCFEYTEENEEPEPDGEGETGSIAQPNPEVERPTNSNTTESSPSGCASTSSQDFSYGYFLTFILRYFWVRHRGLNKTVLG